MMKTSELTGALLDYYVSKAEGILVEIKPSGCWRVYPDGSSMIIFSPSTSWHSGGPIIERERIELIAPCAEGTFKDSWIANTEWGKMEGHFGPTPLIAAMRAYVASKFGDEVEDF